MRMTDINGLVLAEAEDNDMWVRSSVFRHSARRGLRFHQFHIAYVHVLVYKILWAKIVYEKKTVDGELFISNYLNL